ncbi:hypothetical protein QYM36_001614 [Artemia franciscana]|uniref:RNA helicase n=2 Tax=Artemia franciscana TaxID=6661 RepID=A0AA88IR53_ARTSF|nr:hypothetical protein QYM36_001614 [Artemia franciscana]
MVARIIGRGGSKIKELEESSGCRIKILKDQSSGDMVVINLTGGDISEAKRLIEDVTSSAGRQRERFGQQQTNGFSSEPNGSNWDEPSPCWDDQDSGSSNFKNSDRQGRSPMESLGSTEKITIGSSFVARVIGRGGAKIRELQDKSGCRIQILKEESDGNESVISISGQDTSIEEAKRLIMQIVEPSERYGTKQANGFISETTSNDWNESASGWEDRNQGSNDFKKPDQPWRPPMDSSGSSEKIRIDASFVARVIGRGGAKIRELQDKSGCRIQILKEESDEQESVISISGSNIEEAKRLIMEIVEPFDAQKNMQNLNIADNAESDHFEVIDWTGIAKQSEEMTRLKWASLPALKKDFYFEEQEVAEANPADVAAFRKENFDIKVKHHNENDPRPIPNPVLTFQQAFRKFPEILDEIKKQGFMTPSPIQCQSWPILLQGNDMIGIAQTGTGKTLAFLLPALIHIEHQTVPRTERVGPTALVLAPTRELAQQIEKEAKKYNYRGIQSICVYGGGNRREQSASIRKGVEIVIATPGRLNDLISAGIVDVSGVSYLVLDEADRMLDMGFEPQIRKILLDIRPDRQTVMTSATWPPGVRQLAEIYMKDPLHVVVGSFDLAAVHSVTQIIEIVEEEEKISMLWDFLGSMGTDDKCIVFVAKKIRADDIASDLGIKGIECQCIHGNREQSDREEALEQLKDGTVRILIATDVASRGIDIKDITHIFNLDFPNNMEEYVHRVGRTGRAGRSGVAISLVTRQDWSKAAALIKILEEAGQEVPDELVDMSSRFSAAQARRNEERGREFGDRPRRGRGRGGRRDDFGGFGGGGFSGGGFGGRRERW